MLYQIFVYYPVGDMFSSKHMARFSHILESFFDFFHSKVLKLGITCCRRDISYRISIAEYPV